MVTLLFSTLMLTLNFVWCHSQSIHRQMSFWICLIELTVNSDGLSFWCWWFWSYYHQSQDAGRTDGMHPSPSTQAVWVWLDVFSMYKVILLVYRFNGKVRVCGIWLPSYLPSNKKHYDCYLVQNIMMTTGVILYGQSALIFWIFVLQVCFWWNLYVSMIKTPSYRSTRH